jgi:hypothetical protein
MKRQADALFQAARVGWAVAHFLYTANTPLIHSFIPKNWAQQLQEIARRG